MLIKGSKVTVKKMKKDKINIKVNAGSKWNHGDITPWWNLILNSILVSNLKQVLIWDLIKIISIQIKSENKNICDI